MKSASGGSGWTAGGFLRAAGRGPCSKIERKSRVKGTHTRPWDSVRRRHDLGSGRCTASWRHGSRFRGALRIDIRLDQNRARSIALLPVPRQLAQSQRERLRRQTLHPHPGKHQEARLAHHQVQVLLVLALGPADPGVATGQRAGRLAEQQAAQPTSLAVEQEVPQMGTHGLAVAE